MTDYGSFSRWVLRGVAPALMAASLWQSAPAAAKSTCGDEVWKRPYLIDRLIKGEAVKPSDKMELYAIRARLREWQEDFKGSVSDWTKVIALKPGCHWYYLRRGAVYRSMRRFDLALEDARMSMKFQSKQMESYYHLGWTLHEMGRYREAIKTYTAGIPFQPKYSWVYWRRGLAYARLGARAKAIAEYRKAIKLEPTNHDAIASLRRLGG